MLRHLHVLATLLWSPQVLQQPRKPSEFQIPVSSFLLMSPLKDVFQAIKVHGDATVFRTFLYYLIGFEATVAPIRKRDDRKWTIRIFAAQFHDDT